MSDFTNESPFRRIFGGTPNQPPPRLLEQTVIDRDEARNDHVAIFPAAESVIENHSPISTLPEELVQRVFLTYLDTFNQTSTARSPIKYSLARLQAPFLLSSVCRRWRVHALASSLLWTYIVVPALVHTPSTLPHVLTDRVKRDLRQFEEVWIELIQLLLERSGQAGLHIIITKLHYQLLQEPIVAKGLGFHRNALISLVPDRARIQTLCMSIQGIVSSSVLDIIGMLHVAADSDEIQVLDAPRLEHIKLEFTNWGRWIPSYGVHLEAPLLRTCVVQGVSCLLPQISHLVRLEVTIGTLTAWMQTFSFCATTLEVLHLSIVPSDDPEDPQLACRIIFPRLTHFGIATDEYPADTVLNQIFATVSAPKLRTAYFSATCEVPPTAPAFVQFVQYLGSSETGTVKELAVAFPTEYQSLDISDARLIARHLPSIEILTLVSRICVAVGFIGAMHHFAPHTQIRTEHASVWVPTGSPQEQLTVAVEALEHGDGSITERRLAFFDVTQATRDYDNINRTGGILPDYRCTIQTIVDVVIVWSDGPGIGSERGKEQVRGPRYQILPRQVYEMPDPHENDVTPSDD